MKSRAPIVLLAALLVIAGCNSESSGPQHELNPQEQRGEQVFKTNCGVCHNPYSNQVKAGPGLRGLFRKQYLPSGAPANDERVRAAIKNGRVNMPSFAYVLDDEQITDLLAYLHAL